VFAALRSHLLMVVLALLATVAATVAPVDGAVAVHPHVSDPSRPCGGERVVSDGHPWSCTFDDEFGSGRITGANWTVVDARRRYNHFHNGIECYVDEPRNVAVRNGSLVLTATYDPAVTRCGGRLTHYRSGMLTTRTRFAQAYGRFEFRARLPEGAALQPALWLFPDAPKNPWPLTGEIDVAEYFGNVAGRVAPHLHYIDRSGRRAHPGRSCAVRAIGSRFHTYAVEWTPAQMRFVYDGRLCDTVRGWRPRLPLLSPAPFDKPFVINLELALLRSTNSGVVPRTAFPARMYVDYVRVWR
jgi:beta-glucanase (GH16 family)